MNTLRIRGIVRFADRLRRELARPVSPARKAELRAETARFVREIQEIANASGKRNESLPPPSRRAYAFLVGQDPDAVAADAAPAPAAAPGRAASVPLGSIRLVGLKPHWEDLMHEMADSPAGAESEKLYEGVCILSSKVEKHLREHHFRAEDLTTPTRMLRVWLLYFTRRERFELYLDTAALATAAFESAMRGASRFAPPARVEFRSVAHLYQLRQERAGTRVTLPTPMIGFEAEDFRQVATVAIRRTNPEPIRRACASETFQNIQAELEALDGVENAAGVHWDLAACFERVNAAYFGGRLARPRLTWNRVFTGRKFGHFDGLGDTVLISCTLDRADLPEYVLDFVMYHELLHKDLGIDRRNGRAAAHTPEFRARERRFKRYAEADAALGKLAGG
jgi:hypothetical protein